MIGTARSNISPTFAYLQLESLRPSWQMLFIMVLGSYFMVTAGIAYDIINEPPAIGGHQDPVTGVVRPQAFMPYRMNGQYIFEGLCGGFFYTLGGAQQALAAECASVAWPCSHGISIPSMAMLAEPAACSELLDITVPQLSGGSSCWHVTPLSRDNSAPGCSSAGCSTACNDPTACVKQSVPY